MKRTFILPSSAHPGQKLFAEHGNDEDENYLSLFLVTSEREAFYGTQFFLEHVKETGCSQPQEASLSGKSSVNVRQIGSARRRARLSQNAQSLSSEKKRETQRPTVSKVYVKHPRADDKVVAIVLRQGDFPHTNIKEFTALESLRAEDELNLLNSLKGEHWSKWFEIDTDSRLPSPEFDVYRVGALGLRTNVSPAFF